MLLALLLRQPRDDVRVVMSGHCKKKRKREREEKEGLKRGDVCLFVLLTESTEVKGYEPTMSGSLLTSSASSSTCGPPLETGYRHLDNKKNK